ncbi:MAG: xanthine dehydrogenase molybdopterin binding subunit [Bacteroidetes bacterium]|nr:xanthine dehydrogenase molybdopterin binding subunit [Bacteroidota bacterium]
MKTLTHESAVHHVTGSAVYVDDMPINDRLLTGYIVYSPHAHANILRLDVEAARAIPGIHAVLTSRDIPGRNQMGPVVHDEPCLAETEVQCVGQAVVLIAGESEAICRAGAEAIEIEYRPLDAILDLESAMRQNTLLAPERKMERGNVGEQLSSAARSMDGEFRSGAQEHWYLETQCAVCVPAEGREVTLYASTQHPSETQAIVAEVLGIPKNEVTVEVRRMGGAFGGKETQANHVAAWAALLANKTGRPVKVRLFRDDDQIITGKRHRFFSRYRVGFRDDGLLTVADIELNCDAGCATDLTMAILERAMMHVDNSYFIPHVRIVGRAWKTNLPSNTAFRGFGGPQGMAVMENILDRIARVLGKDPLEIRRINLYGKTSNNTTPYGQTVDHNHLPDLFDQILKSSEYEQRRVAIDAFNETHDFQKKGMALSPVKFGISFTTSFLNQAGALVNIYKDGSLLVNHGGTEMGQGLHTKIRQIAAKEFGIPMERVKVNATNTSKVPNTSATAASAGTDLNGAAVKNAIDQLKFRLSRVAARHFSELALEVPSSEEDIVFEEDSICDMRYPKRRLKFDELMPLAVSKGTSLSATGYYKTPNIHFDRERGTGRPFHYFAFGVAVTEVLVDILTGHHEILRTDILHDVGDSINPAIDIGQIEGGYIQGVGWCTTEEMKWNNQGHTLTHSPDTYKIPSVQDIPKDFRVQLLQQATNSGVIHGSKAVAEPPFMLALSCWLAIKDAVSAVGSHRVEPELEIPATAEAIVLAGYRLRHQIKHESVL